MFFKEDVLHAAGVHFESNNVLILGPDEIQFPSLDLKSVHKRGLQRSFRIALVRILMPHEKLSLFKS